MTLRRETKWSLSAKRTRDSVQTLRNNSQIYSDRRMPRVLLSVTTTANFTVYFRYPGEESIDDSSTRN